MNSKMIYSLTALAIAVYAIGFLRSDFRDQPSHKVNWQLADGRLVDGPSEIKLQQGQQLILIVQSNRPEQLILRGHDSVLQLTTDTPQVLDIQLLKAGHFSLELQPQGTQLGTLDVRSK